MAENTESFSSFLKQAPASARKQILTVLSIGAFGVLVAIGTILWIWKVHRGPSVTAEVLETSRKLASHEAPAFAHPYEIKDMSMALMNKKATRTAYSQFTLIFDCATEGCKKNLEVNRAKLINAIFEVGGDMFVEDFEAPIAAKGFAQFKDAIHKKTKEYFGGLAPASVLLKDWVMN